MVEVEKGKIHKIKLKEALAELSLRTKIVREKKPLKFIKLSSRPEIKAEIKKE
jgi:hypothetical protein